MEKLGENPIGATEFMNATYHVTDEPNVKCSTFVDALLMCGLSTSRAEARKLIAAGGCYVNDVRLTEDRAISTDDLVHWKWILMRKGKRTYSLMQFNDVGQFFQR